MGAGYRGRERDNEEGGPGGGDEGAAQEDAHGSGAVAAQAWLCAVDRDLGDGLPRPERLGTSIPVRSFCYILAGYLE